MGGNQTYPPALHRGYPMAVRSLRHSYIPLVVLLLAAALAWTAPVAASQKQSHAQASKKHARAHLTLEQAVARVRKQTGGKVLKADSRNTGRAVEYRIKVLTPAGHVRVITLRSDPRNADSN